LVAGERPAGRANGPAEVPSALDRLNPAQIPADERFDWQPKDLVAVLGSHRGRHWDGIESVAFSPNGKQIASVGDGVVRLWDAETLREVAVLRGHKEGVVAAAYSTDGNALASAGLDGTIRLWDLTKAEPKVTQVLEGHERGIVSIAFSRDGKRAYVADEYSKDGAQTSSLRVVDVSDPKAPTVVASIERPGQLRGLAVSGNYLFAATRQDFFYVIDLSDPKTPKEVTSLRGTGEGMGVVLSGKYAYVPDRDGFLHIVDVSDPKAPKLVGSSPDEPGIALAAAIDGHHVYVGSKRGFLHVLDVSDPRAPVWVGSYKTQGITNGVTVAGGLVSSTTGRAA
jgi:hypothetical protein